MTPTTAAVIPVIGPAPDREMRLRVQGAFPRIPDGQYKVKSAHELSSPGAHPRQIA